MRVSYFIQEMIEMISEVQMRVVVEGTDLDNKAI